VGKTELAKTLADFLFNDEKALTRIDMSEYGEKHTVSRLIGAPPGYVGYDEGGQLTEAVRRRPYSVVLFDEVEKAHPDVFNVFLQIFDDGRLTDGQGRVVDFKNVIIIMTSNLPQDQLKNLFRPECLNRIDETIVFNTLDKAEISRIVDIQLRRLQKRMAARRLNLDLSEAAKQHLAERGFDPQYGARPLKRTIQNEVENPLASGIIAGKYPEGSTIKVEVGADGELSFTA
jgi:ATP-dependent Clp protease ATP-binding subunit ClpB